MRRTVRRQQVGVALFPFLAVLICTMGSLIVLLVLLVQQARLDARSIAAEQRGAPASSEAELQQQLEDAKWRRELLEQSRAEKSKELADSRAKLAHLEDHIQRLAARARDLLERAQAIDQGQQLQDDQLAAAQAELARLQQEIARKQTELDEARKKLKAQEQWFALIPYQGPHGTRRRPIYIECTEAGVILQPEGLVLSPEDFSGPLGPHNPLDAALRTIREHINQTERGTGEPYPLLVVRPSGVVAYGAARAALKDWDEEFGYELVGDDKKLVFGSPDPALAEVLQKSVAVARRRQAALAAMMPRRYPGDEPLQSFSTESVAGDRSAMGGLGSGGRGTGRGPGGTEMGGRGAGAGGSPPRGAAGAIGGGLAGGDQFAGSPAGGPIGPASGAGEAAGIYGAGGGAGYGQSGGADVGHGGSGLAGNGQGTGTTRGAAANGGNATGGNAAGGNAAGGNAAGPYGNANSGQPSGNSPNQIGGRPGQSGTISNQASSSGSPSGNASAGGSPGGSASGASSGQLSGASSGSSDTPPTGAPSANLTFGSPAPPGSAAKSSAAAASRMRGQGWALPGASRHATAITRPIHVAVLADRLVLVPERGSDRAALHLRISDEMTVDEIDKFVAAVQREMKSWGLAVANGYWKPVLQAEVAPDAEQHFAELQMSLANSGFDVQRKQP